MTTIQEVRATKSKDKNIKMGKIMWRKCILKRKKAYFSSLPIPTAQILALIVVV